MLVVAYIGFGNSVCRYHLPYVSRRKDKVKVKYIYRREEDRVGDTEREAWYPEITFTPDINKVLDDPEVNLIVVSAPHEFHVEYSKLAIEHGKNVLCEKPFALSSKEAEEVFSLAKEKGVVVMANQNRRFDADMLTLKKVLDSGLLGQLIDVESHYDYYRPTTDKKIFYLISLAVHTLDQMVGYFGLPKKVAYDCKSIEYPGKSDEYFDIDLFYDNRLKVNVKSSYYVKLDYPRFIAHGTKGSFILYPLGHQSDLVDKPGPVEISFNPAPEKYWGTLSYIDDEGNDITKKVPCEVGDYGKIYDNLYDVIFNGKEKVVKDEQTIGILKIIEKGIEIAKEAQ